MKIVSARKPCMVYAFDLADCSKQFLLSRFFLQTRLSRLYFVSPKSTWLKSNVRSDYCVNFIFDLKFQEVSSNAH